jgi:FAD/FMN-containing dehydrogenase
MARMSRRLRIPSWTVFGTIYGTSRTTAAAKRTVRELARPVTRRVTFVSPGAARRLRRLADRLPRSAGARLASRAALLEGSLDLVSGRPSEVTLPLAYWKQAGLVASAPRDPTRDGCGLIWYAPLVVMKSGIVERYVDFVTRTLTLHRIEPLVTLTSLSDRCFDSSVPLLFDRSDPDATARANPCYRSLLDEGAREGFVPYRVGIGAMDWLEARDTVAWQLLGKIKRSLDPDGIIAPGRYSPSAPTR